mmetsp:Transcript_36254/g.90227  ORF Transcript_36254/g.90227 Transcript_36254/m.90227 type:complete len:232 (+) Transcript_36254:969-1664(+)
MQRLEVLNRRGAIQRRLRVVDPCAFLLLLHQTRHLGQIEAQLRCLFHQPSRLLRLSTPTQHACRSHQPRLYGREPLLDGRLLRQRHIELLHAADQLFQHLEPARVDDIRLDQLARALAPLLRLVEPLLSLIDLGSLEQQIACLREQCRHVCLRQLGARRSARRGPAEQLVADLHKAFLALLTAQAHRLRLRSIDPQKLRLALQLFQLTQLARLSHRQLRLLDPRIYAAQFR